MRERGGDVRALLVCALVLLSILALTDRAAAADGPHVECPASLLNDVAAKATVDSGAPAPKLLWDGVFALEESVWPESDRFASFRVLTLDFGTLRRATGLVIQTDADSPFALGFSEDGKSWVSLSAPALREKSGMASRRLPAPPSSFRYVQLRATGQAGRLACSEFQLLCGAEIVHSAEDQRARRLEQELEAVASEAAREARSPNRFLLVTIYLSIAASLLALRRWAERSTKLALIRVAALGVTAVLALGSYLKLGPHGYAPHRHELFHYELGSKYFAELGYDGLYDCAIAAEIEAGFGDRVLASTFRDLPANKLVPGKSGFERLACKQRFSPERWREFGGDVGYFARSLGARGFRKVLWDHGYNPSPLWTAAGQVSGKLFGTRPLANEPFSNFHAHPVLPLLDIALLSGILITVGIAFGFEAACLVAIALSCNTLADPTWTRGALLRFLWLFSLFAGFVAFKRERPGWGAFWLVIAGGFSLFPLFALIPIVALGVTRYLRHRALPAVLRRSAVGAAGGLLFVVTATMVTPGLRSWPAFFENTSRHAQTISQNHVGLRTALSYRPATRANVLFDPAAPDPFAPIIEARRNNLRPLFPVYLGAVAIAFALLARRLARHRTEVEVSGVTLLELGLSGLLLVGLVVDLSSYYFALLAVFALRPGPGKRGPGTVIGLLLALSSLPLLGELDDTSYAIASVFLCAWLFWQLWLFGAKPAASPPMT